MAAKKVRLEGAVYVDGVEIGDTAKEFVFSAEAAVLDSTTFGSGGWREVEAGGAMHDPVIRGLLPDAVDDVSQDVHLVLRTAGKKVIAAAETRPVAAGDFAVLLKALRVQFSTPQRVNELGEYECGLALDGRLSYGVCLANLSAISATGSSADIEVAAVAAGATARAILVITDADGAVAYTELIEFAGPVTDTWWRITYTIAGGDLDVIVESDVDTTFATPTTRGTFTTYVGDPNFDFVVFLAVA